jgi:hypothetical protein
MVSLDIGYPPAAVLGIVPFVVGDAKIAITT